MTRDELLRQSKNVNERHISGMPSRNFRYQDVRLKESGGSKLMNVDGSGAPVDFFIQPPVGELWIVPYVTLLIIDPGDMGPEVFGSFGAALTNGLKLIEEVNSVESVYTTLVDNADLVQCFFGAGLSGIAAGLGADAGFLNSVDKALGRMEFSTPIILNGDDNDKLLLRVADDLLLIEYMAASAHIRVER